MIKHNFVALETHSWMVANIALTIAREHGLSSSDQRLAWEYGLVHDAGWLNLKAGFNHENVDEKSIDLLLHLVGEKYPEFKDYGFKSGKPSLIEFAMLHAKSHIDESIQARLLQNGVWNCVIRADSLATGREVVGFVFGKNVIRVFTTDLKSETPYRRINLARLSEHYERINKFHGLLSQISDRISGEVGVPYDPLITATDTIEYHLSSRDEAWLRREYDDWLDKTRGEDVANDTTLKRGKKERCIFCGKDGHYRTHISKLTKFEIETWRSGYRQKAGICQDCLYAISHYKISGNVVVTPPRIEPEKFMDLMRLRKILRKWGNYKAEGKCDVDSSYLDELFWRESRLVSRTFDSIDARREVYEMSLKLLDETIGLLAMDRHGIYGARQLDYGEAAETLKEAAETATICVDCIRTGKPDEIIIKGLAFPKYEGVIVLKLLSMIKRGLPLESLRTFDEFLAEVAMDMDVRELEALEEKYDQLRELLMANG